MGREFQTYRDPALPRLWDGVIVVATLVSLVVVVLDARHDASTRESRLLGWLDLGLCGIFLLDFFTRIRLAEDRRAFLRRNWIDLASSIPLVDALRAGRVVRVLRLLRMVRVSFVRERILRRYGVYISSELLNGVGLVAVVVWLATAGTFYLFEKGDNRAITSFGDALWWSMTTLSTVGYGDLYPVTVGGRIVAVVTMVLGVGVIGTLAATVATVFIDIRDRGKRGLRSYSMRGHLLILGWNDKAERALAEFRADARYLNAPAAIVADLEQNPTEIPGVRFVRGDPGQREVLERASVREAAAAIVFASDPAEPRSDHETALTILAIKRFVSDLPITAELVDADNREHLIAAGCETVVEGNELTSALLIRSVQDRGIGQVISELLSSRRGAEIRRCEVEPSFIGKRYRDFALDRAAAGSPVLGLVRAGQVLVNPDPELAIEAGDHAFVIARPHDGGT
ncbi:MAG: ion transporter [Myxococcales bacterium]|nr:ion transporter [Myxococcales bacterium]